MAKKKSSNKEKAVNNFVEVICLVTGQNVEKNRMYGSLLRSIDFAHGLDNGKGDCLFSYMLGVSQGIAFSHPASAKLLRSAFNKLAKGMAR